MAAAMPHVRALNVLAEQAMDQGVGLKFTVFHEADEGRPSRRRVDTISVSAHYGGPGYSCTKQ